MTFIDSENRAAEQVLAHPRRRRWLRPALAIPALALTVITGAVVVGGRGDDGASQADGPSTVKTPSAEASSTATVQQKPPRGKLRAFQTVKELTDAADLIVRGTPLAAGRADKGTVSFQVKEVLYAPDGSRVTAGARVKVALIDPAIADAANMSKLEPGQDTVLYLGLNGEDFNPLSADFGIFDVKGDTATARSLTMSVRGLRTADPDAQQDVKFTTNMADLKSVAREHAPTVR